MVANAYCPVCAEEEGNSIGDGLCRWYIPTDSLLSWVKDDNRYLTRSSAEIKQFAESFSGPGTDNVAGLAEAIEGVYGEKPAAKKRLQKRGDKGGRRPRILQRSESSVTTLILAVVRHVAMLCLKMHLYIQVGREPGLHTLFFKLYPSMSGGSRIA